MDDKIWTVQAVLQAAQTYLLQRGVDSARLDSELLLAQALGLKRLDLYLRFDQPLTDDERAPFRGLLKRRGAREPLAYILGQREFYGHEFFVGPEVLVPRPETELLVDLALQHFSKQAPPRFLELCLGTACVTISLLKAWTAARAVGIDISTAALGYAQKNAQHHRVQDRLDLVQGDLAEALQPVSDGAEAGKGDETALGWPLVLANPPYVTDSEWQGLAAEIVAHEPRLALVSAEQGLEHSRRMALWLRDNLAPGGLALIEGAAARGAELLELFDKNMGSGCALEIVKDLSGRDRVLRVLRA